MKNEEAKQLFLNGANCAQAVLCAFCKETGMDTETAMKIASSFGGGMGRLREVCGACSGMFMVAGLLDGYSSTDATTQKAEHYARIQMLAEKFKEKNGSIICRDLIAEGNDTSPVPSERTDKYYKKRPCAEYVADAAQILEEYLKKEGRI